MRHSRPATALFVLATLTASTALAVQKSSTSSQVERGKYLVNIAGCHDCHSPKANQGSVAPDPTKLLSGRPATTMAPAKPVNMGEISAAGDLTAWYGPWGVSYSANLTPDPTTGLGKRYTEASFIATLRSGKKPEGEPLLPPMPWEVYRQMTDQDLKAIWAYLKTIKPIVNNVKVAVPAK